MSTPLDASTRARISEIQSLSLEALDERFRSGRVPAFDRYAGPTTGAWLHRETQPWWAAVFVRIALDSPWARWTGKGFSSPSMNRDPGRA